MDEEFKTFTTSKIYDPELSLFTLKYIDPIRYDSYAQLIKTRAIIQLLLNARETFWEYTMGFDEDELAAIESEDELMSEYIKEELETTLRWDEDFQRQSYQMAQVEDEYEFIVKLRDSFHPDELDEIATQVGNIVFEGEEPNITPYADYIRALISDMAQIEN